MYLLRASPDDETPEELEMEFGGRCLFTRHYLHRLADADALIREFADGRVSCDSPRWDEL